MTAGPDARTPIAARDEDRHADERIRANSLRAAIGAVQGRYRADQLDVASSDFAIIPVDTYVTPTEVNTYAPPPLDASFCFTVTPVTR